MSGRRLIACLSFLEHATHTIKGSRQHYTQLPSPIELYKHPSRGGRNLSEQFRRLEKTLLTKHSLNEAIADAPQPPKQIPPSTPQRPSTTKVFRGLVIPEVPRAPESDECCMSGCAVCVHDLYQEALDVYRASVLSVRTSLTAMKVPMEQWPETIRPKAEEKTHLLASSISLNAFEEMERALKARREAKAQNHRRTTTAQRPRKQRWRWKLVDFYEGLRWIIFSNR